MKWIIENLTKEPSYLELSAAAKELGFDVYDIRGDFKNSDLDRYHDEKVIFVGCIEMCNLIRPQLIERGCYPATFANFEKYLCSQYYPHFGYYLFNDNYVMVPLKELKRRPYFFYGIFGREANIFLRPDSGEKTFKAGLTDLQDLDQFYNQVKEYENDLVVISSPKTINGEWRFLCNDQQEIIAVSSYRYQGLLTKVPSAPIKATEFCKQILSVGYYPDPIFCVDVAQCSDGEFWLMELTSFSSAGLYRMDMKKVVRGVEKRIHNN
jgi:hypothetical protein